MSRIKNYYHDELIEVENEDPDFCYEGYDIIEPALTNEPMHDEPPF